MSSPIPRQCSVTLWLAFTSPGNIIFLLLLKNAILLCGRRIYRQQSTPKETSNKKLPPYVKNEKLKQNFAFTSGKKTKTYASEGVIFCFYFPDFTFILKLSQKFYCVWVTTFTCICCPVFWYVLRFKLRNKMWNHITVPLELPVVFLFYLCKFSFFCLVFNRWINFSKKGSEFIFLKSFWNWIRWSPREILTRILGLVSKEVKWSHSG